MLQFTQRSRFESWSYYITSWKEAMKTNSAPQIASGAVTAFPCLQEEKNTIMFQMNYGSVVTKTIILDLH